MNLFDLVAKIILDTDDFDNGLDRARGTAEKFGGALKSGLATAAKVGAAAVTAATAAATAFAKSAIDVGMEFDASMSQVAATMGYSVEELNDATSEASQNFRRLREFAQEMGAKTAFSATEAASALNYMALAGYNTEQSMQALPNVLNLAAAGGIDLASASDMVTDAQSALGLSMDESAELVDKMAKASSKSNTSVAQLGDAILTVGGTAKNLAGGTTEMATALGILADNGIKGAEGGTALRNIILSLGAPTDKAAEALEAMGVKVYDAAGNMRPLNETFKDLDFALSAMTQGEQTQVLNTIFNKVDLKSVNALLANTGERFDELSTAINGAWYTADSLKASLENYDINYDDLISQVSELGITQEEVKNALDSSGGSANTFLDKMLELADAGTEIDDIVEALGIDVYDLGAAFNETTGAAQAMADTQLDNLSGDITLFKSAFEGAQIAISDRMTPTLREFVQFATEGLTQVTDAFNGAGSGVEGLAEKIKSSLEGGSSFKQILDMLSSDYGLSADEAKTAFDAVNKALATTSGSIEDITSSLENSGIEWENYADSAWMSSDGISGAMEALGTVLSNAIGMIASKLPSFIEAGMNILGALAQGILNNLPVLANSALEIIGILAQGILEAVPEMAQSAAELMSNFGTYLSENLPDMISAGLELVSNLAETIRSNAGVLAEGAIDLLIGFAQGLADSLPAMIEHIPDIVSSIANVINDNAPKLLAAAAQIVVTLAVGIVQAIPVLIEHLPDIAEAIWNVFTAINWINLGSTIVNGIGNGIKAMIGFAKGAIGEVKTALVTNIKAIPETFMKLGRDIIQGLIEGIKSMAKAALNSVKELFTSIVSTVKDALGIHSPSRVFAGIGENMALGLGAGWENEFSSLKNRIENDMDFGTASIDFEQSGLAASNRSVVSGLLSGLQESSFTGDFVINLTSEMDGEILARKLFRYNRAESSINGYSLVEGASM